MMSSLDRKEINNMKKTQHLIVNNMGIIATVVFMVAGSTYVLLPIFLGSSIKATTELAMILMFSAIISICI